MTYSMYDSAYPPTNPPTTDAVGFYIGGDTPHIWSDQEIAAQKARFRLPIYVCDNPGQRNATLDAQSAVSWLRSRNAPLGCVVALDYETAVNGAYVLAFDKVVTAAGYRTLLYGTKSTVVQNPKPSGGYWFADWTGTAHISSGSVATQWASDLMLNTTYDLSDVSPTLALWDARPPAPNTSGDTMPAFQTGEVKPGFFTDAKNVTDTTKATMLVLPPAGGGALNWGGAWISFGTDFGTVGLRVAVKVGGQAWAVQTLTVGNFDDRVGFQLPMNVQKVSIGRVAQSATDTADSVPCGWLLEYGA
jgi:hypothetical protein